MTTRPQDAKRLSILLRGVALIGMLATLSGTAILVTKGGISAGDVAAVTGTLTFGVLVWLIAPTQGRNPLTWVLALFVLFVGFYPLGQALWTLNWPDFEVPSWEEPLPSDIPPGFELTVGLTQAMGGTGVLALLTFGILLFPDGRLPSRRWRWLAYFCAIGLVYWFFTNIPLGLLRESDLLSWIWFIFLLGPLLCVVSLVVRFRKADAVTRNQIKWILWGTAVVVPFMVIAVSGEGPEWLGAIGLFVLASSYAIAIVRYRLYDIDLVISRTLVYGTLAIFIGAVYVAIVVGLGTLIGEPDGNPWLGIAATVVIAIVFQPLRRWLQRLANRIVYGRRATPYEVLSSFSQSISTVDPDVLTQVARSLAEGTTANSASIWIDRSGALQCIAAWPEMPGDRPDPSAVAAPVVHEGEELGRIALDIPPGQPFSPNDRRLLDQVAAGLGLALRNLLLTEDLRVRVDELAASRRRIVSVQDEARRKLERDLHDGAQQRLVSLKIKLGIGGSMAEKSGLDEVKTMIDSVREETDQTIEAVRDFARGIYPPLLEAEGLGPALGAQARKMPIPVAIQSAGLSRYPKEQEATVYFCVLEALQNAMKHSEATSVQVVLADRDGELSFQVRDDGVGFVAAEVEADGLVNMKDRVEAIGGEFDVDSEPGRGTTITGVVPVRELVTS